MKFIPELLEDVQIIVENSSNIDMPKSYYIDGVYVQANTPNRNGRMYPLPIVQKEIQRYREQFIDTKRALGELGHPESGSINLDRASHLITKLEQNGNDFIGRAKLLDTPLGKIAKNFVDEGVRLGVSTRGFGSLKAAKNGIQEVADDFHLSTVDIVADPSAPSAFVEGIMEGKEFYLKEGVLCERQMDQIRKEVKGLSRRELDEGALIKIFDKFMRNI